MTEASTPDLGPVLNPLCAKEITVNSSLVQHEGERRVLVSAECLRCARSVLVFASDIGSDEHLADIAQTFGTPGHFSAR